ncbi:MAG: hypothetical protein ACREAC_08425, partial [Blastocatellia bacterium]
PIVIRTGDRLLCVIHGYGANGWRDLSSRQTYLLKGVVGSGMRTENRKAFADEHKGNVPPIAGDVIIEGLSGRIGFLFYNGANYGWLGLPGSPSHTY